MFTTPLAKINNLGDLPYERERSLNYTFGPNLVTCHLERMDQFLNGM